MFSGVGIDTFVLKNLKIEFPPEIKKGVIGTSDGGLQEGVTEKGEGFIIYSFIRLAPDGEWLPPVNTLMMNPNRILEGNNIKNSKAGRIYDALKKLEEKLKRKNIHLDFSESEFDTVEVNININKDFAELDECNDLLFYIKSNGRSKKTSGDDKNYIRKNRRKSESYWFKEYENIYRVYNKTLEIKEKENILLDVPVTRYEIKFSAYNFKKIFLRENLSCKLITVLTNFELIEKEFKSIWFEILKKSFKFLEENHAKNIGKLYKNFKDTQRSARERKKIDPTAKMQYGVYKYLAENFKVFDKKYIYEVIETYNDRNIQREKSRANKYFLEKNGLEKIEFLSDFFCTNFSKMVQENRV